MKTTTATDAMRVRGEAGRAAARTLAEAERYDAAAAAAKAAAAAVEREWSPDCSLFGGAWWNRCRYDRDGRPANMRARDVARWERAEDRRMEAEDAARRCRHRAHRLAQLAQAAYNRVTHRVTR